MFDRHVHVLGPRSVDVRTHVTEQRAPTDESVRLLKEMESAAREKVLETVRLEGNGFNGVLHFAQDHMSGDVMLWCVYEWKGERRKVIYRTSESPNLSGIKGRTELALGLRDELAKDIANAVIGPALRAVKW